MFDRELRTLSHVPRWGILRVIKRQNVAEHTFYVAMYTYQIMEFLGYGTEKERYEAMVYVLHHDVSEYLLSDIPHHVKTLINRSDLSKCERSIEKDIFHYNRPELNNDLKSIIKVADLLDSLLYLHSERNMGNNDVDEVVVDIRQQMRPFLNDLPGDPQLIRQLCIIIQNKENEEYEKKSGYKRFKLEDLVEIRRKE